MKLASRLASIAPSPTLALNAKAKAMAASGVDVVSFAAGEPDFDTPAHIKKAAVAALEAGQTKYTATPGIPELRKAITEKLKKENALAYEAEQVLVSVGAKHTLYNAFQALLSPGDEVLIFAPFWVSYPEMVRLAGGTPVLVPTNEALGLQPDIAAAKKLISARTRAVVINSPCNPTGCVWSSATLEAIADMVAPHDCVLITDDIYEKLNFTGQPFVNIVNVAPALKDRTLVVNGFSKAYAMTGWRLGWGAGPKALIAAMQIVQDQSTSNASSFSQYGAVAALTGPQEGITEMVTAFQRRRDLICKLIDATPGVSCVKPQGAFYVMANVSSVVGKTVGGLKIDGGVAASTALLEQFHVAAVPGEPFGINNHVRLSFATSDKNIERGVERLKRFVEAAK